MHRSYSSTFSRSINAGPVITLPQGSNLDPWHGWSHVFSALFHPTTHRMCVHTGEHS
ncbi:MAG TPA: hypothetical protein VH277_06785 [Gemmatimonadaceae bacterium]|jgi:hypothetical protein|nr:hypothetical protein [Gemmatimonadaceae bacterium]